MTNEFLHFSLVKLYTSTKIILHNQPQMVFNDWIIVPFTSVKDDPIFSSMIDNVRKVYSQNK